MFTTVQDLGRPGHSALGVPASGATDPLSLRLGNRIVGNPDGAAGLEFTLDGPCVVFDQDVVVCLAGGDCPDAAIGRPAGPERLPPCTPVRVRAGELIRIGPVRTGARGYLCVGGGFVVDLVMGSRSTLVSAGFGGHEGRALRPGDRLGLGERADRAVDVDDSGRAARWLAGVRSRRVLRVTPGLHAGLFPAHAAHGLDRSGFTVSDRCDRVGVRLEGAGVPQPEGAGRMDSEPTETGAVQVPGDGRPIVLGMDRPTTGGYPVIACVIAADLPVLGMLRPGEAVRFEHVTREAARKAWRQQESELDALVRAVASDGEGP